METPSLSTKGIISAAMTTVMPKLEAAIGPLLTQYPHWQLAMYIAIESYGFHMACKQESVNEFVEFLRSHPEVFRKEIVESEEFRDGFVLVFQDYLKLRTREKRDIAKRIFLGFTETAEKQEFPIEQLDDILLKISARSLETLAFICKEILPLKEKTLRDELKEKDLDESEKERRFELAWKRESISKFIHKWIYENYSPSGEKMKGKYGDTKSWDKDFLNEIFEKEQERNDEINVATEDLVRLGILKMRVIDGGIGSGAGAEYDFTQLGYQFLEYVS